MDAVTRAQLENLRSDDKRTQNTAFFALIEMTDKPVDWAYDVWDDMVQLLSDKDNHLRAISAQLLCNLAKSDPENRMLKDFDALLNVTRDERFVTARHCMQAIWKVGAADKKQQQKLIDGLEIRYNECISEKNCTLIRFDIIQSLRNLYDVAPDEIIREKALAWIEAEDDVKYRKKYARVWK
jgi:hypothetical protein